MMSPRTVYFYKGTAVVSLISSITKLAEISETEIRDVSRL
jgi:hypothetical protein